MNEAHSLNDVCHRYLVRPLPLDGHSLRDHTRLVLNEVKRLDHEVDGHLPVHTDRKHSDNSTLQAVAEDKSRAAAFLHIERDALKTTHVEEGLVLDSCKARVVKEPAVHKVTLLKEVILVLLRGSLS